MTNKVFYLDNLGNSLEVTGGKVNVKPDNTGNVQFEVTEQGIKGNVELPAAFDPSQLNEKIEQVKTAADGAQAQATLANEKNGTQDTEIEQLKTKNTELEQALNAEKAKVTTLEGKVQALEERKDIRVANAQVVEDTKLQLTFENSDASVEVDLAKFLQVVPSATDVYAEVKDQILTDVKAALKGEEVQDFGGVTKGFLIKTDA